MRKFRGFNNGAGKRVLNKLCMRISSSSSVKSHGLTEIAECLVSVSTARISSPVQSKPFPEYP